jgi:hypothetical protein
MASLFAVAVIVSGCASTPHPASRQQAAASNLDCRQLASELASAHEKKRAAVEKGESAWKAVIPIAVAARYASGKKEAAEAGDHVQRLEAEAARQGCIRHGG